MRTRRAQQSRQEQETSQNQDPLVISVSNDARWESGQQEAANPELFERSLFRVSATELRHRESRDPGPAESAMRDCGGRADEGTEARAGTGTGGMVETGHGGEELGNEGLWGGSEAPGWLASAPRSGGCEVQGSHASALQRRGCGAWLWEGLSDCVGVVKASVHPHSTPYCPQCQQVIRDAQIELEVGWCRCAPPGCGYIHHTPLPQHGKTCQSFNDIEEDKNIFDYCRENNIDHISKAINSQKVDVNTKDEEGRALLHWACDRGHKELVSVLLQHKADINSQVPIATGSSLNRHEYLKTRSALLVLQLMVSEVLPLRVRETHNNRITLSRAQPERADGKGKRGGTERGRG
ncbi:unnamed protein product [Menidia menidia]|uniref:(Atlantic silverside) hypothetical protein n=1 Tax=Menidia menidia TaxID=238744 RepID=A0A8S4ABI9_9TELE|nr:unnamed protein product [Menidia menidia]